MDIDKLIPHVHQLHAEGTRIGFINSDFDLFNAEHCLMLKDARVQCNFLVVGLKNDDSLIQSWQERLILLESIRYVNAIVKYTTDEELYNIVKRLCPDVRIVDSKYEGQKIDDMGIPIYWYRK